VHDTTPRNGPILVDVDGTPSGNDAVAWAAEEARCHGVPMRVLTRAEPEQVLLGAGDAAMIVVGSASLLKMDDLAGGSAAMTLAVRAGVPVVVVRPGLPDAAPGPSAGRVVAGVDGTALSEAAVDFAFAEARVHGCGVTLVHAVDREAGRAEGEATLAPLAGRGEDVRTVVAASHPLIAESAGARMLVVGSRGRGGLGGMLLGSVSQAVVHRAHCPVAVVRVRVP
jgi:nucleotide-binding universal stress UspA family protein